MLRPSAWTCGSCRRGCGKVEGKPQGNDNGKEVRLDAKGVKHVAGELGALRVKVEALERGNALLREELRGCGGLSRMSGPAAPLAAGDGGGHSIRKRVSHVRVAK